jgi:hypothetical protein
MSRFVMHIYHSAKASPVIKMHSVQGYKVPQIFVYYDKVEPKVNVEKVMCELSQPYHTSGIYDDEELVRDNGEYKFSYYPSK